MSEDEAWAAEERFWTGGEAHYDAVLDPKCLMVFPPPAGIMTAAAAFEGLKRAPRWDRVTMTERTLSAPGEGVRVLAYRARGEREGEAPYEALCSSTYRRDGERWLLVQHQQTIAG